VKILWVKPGKLFPLDTGGKLRTYNILRNLCANHPVTYLSYFGGSRDAEYEREVLTHLPGIALAPVAIPDTTGSLRYIDYMRRLPWRAPYAVSRFTHPRVKSLLSKWMPERSFDVVVCDFLASTLNFPPELATPTLLFQHNVESLLWKRRSHFETNLRDRVIAKIESAKMDRYEPSQVRRFHRVLAVSEQDRQTMCWMTDPSRISVIPTGVDLAKYRYDPHAKVDANLVVFTGSMDWAPNVDGVEYFCAEIWPQVLARVSGARFRIVGRDPHPRVRRLAAASVEVTGTVPSVVEHLRAAAVIVVPLRAGGGTRIKIYEGMALGKATVSTPVGAEGLDIHHEHDILLAEEPRQFAEHVIRLLSDEEMRRRYGAAAAATAQKYDWSVITSRFVEALQKTIQLAPSPSNIAKDTKVANA
jgi:glycosyltransferase involved in cell wall biosynthesis